MTLPLLAPTITVTIGRQTRVYHAFITTAPAAYDAPSTLTLHAASLTDVAGAWPPTWCGWSWRGVSGPAASCWSRPHSSCGSAPATARGYLFTPADPLLVGLNTLQHWLWHRIGLPPADRPRGHA